MIFRPHLLFFIFPKRPGTGLRTTRKLTKGPPHKYRYEDEPIPILNTSTFGVDGTYGWALGTGWWHQLVPKTLHRYRMVTFILVPGSITNRCLWMRHRYRLVTGTLGSSTSYFKMKIFPSQPQLLRRWDGKGATHKAKGRRFESQPKDILREYFGTGWNLDPVPKEALGIG